MMDDALGNDVPFGDALTAMPVDHGPWPPSPSGGGRSAPRVAGKDSEAISALLLGVGLGLGVGVGEGVGAGRALRTHTNPAPFFLVHVKTHWAVTTFLPTVGHDAPGLGAAPAGDTKPTVPAMRTALSRPRRPMRAVRRMPGV